MSTWERKVNSLESRLIMKKILYFSNIMWDDLKQRPQHLAEELSKWYQVIYIEPTISLLTSLVKKNNYYKKRYMKINNNLEVIRTSGLLKIPNSFGFINYNKTIDLLTLRQIADAVNIIWYCSPIHYNEKIVSNKIVVFDKMDEDSLLTSNKRLKNLISYNEEKLKERADIVFITAEKFRDEFKNKRFVFKVENAVDKYFVWNRGRVDSFNLNVISTLQKFKRENCLIFGYIGTISSWFDFDVIRIILESDNKNVVVLVGKWESAINIQHERFLYFKPIPKDSLASVVDLFDYCLYPFKIDELIETINPVKVYEYISLGKVVISPNCKEMERFNKNVLFYKNERDLKKIIADIKRGKIEVEKYNEEEFFKGNNWEQRAKQIKDVIEIYFRQIQGEKNECMYNNTNL